MSEASTACSSRLWVEVGAVLRYLVTLSDMNVRASIIHRALRSLAIAACLALWGAATADAAPLRWVLSGVTFADGGIATGSFFFDADTSTVSNWNVSVSGGNTGTFPPFTYDVGSSDVNVFNAGNPGDTINFSAGMAPSRDLRLTPVADLTNAGGSVALDLTTMNAMEGNLECFNCSPSRFITAGALVQVQAAVAAPLLDLRGLLALMAVLSAHAWRRYAGRSASL